MTSENSGDDILRTNAETTLIPSQQTRHIEPMLVFMLDHRLRRWPNVEPALRGDCWVVRSARYDL